MTATVGIVGLGVMGSRIAGRLLGSGHTVVGTNRTPVRSSGSGRTGRGCC